MAKTYRLGITRRLVNWIVRALLSIGLGPVRTYLLVVPGRKTGRLYKTPVTLVEESGNRWLVAPYGEVGWVRNVRAARSVTLRRGLHSENLRVVELDARAAAPVLRNYIRDIAITRPFFDVKPHSTLDEFAAEAPRHPVFHLRP